MSRRSTQKISQGRHTTGNHRGDTQLEISQQTHKKHDRSEQGDQHQKYTRFIKTH
jgi:hypothetical protein